jgi:hypothetical protein
MDTVTSQYEEHSVQYYAREVRQHLPATMFERTPGRLLWLPVHLGIIAALAFYVVRAVPPWYVSVLCALLAGHSWGCLGFLAHETMHHAITGALDAWWISSRGPFASNVADPPPTSPISECASRKATCSVRRAGFEQPGCESIL